MNHFQKGSDFMVNTIGKLECDKLELQLGINSFDNPTQLSELKAWSQLMLNLIFLEKGTYPSLPDMGVGIQNYEYGIRNYDFELLQKIADINNLEIIIQDKNYDK